MTIEHAHELEGLRKIGGIVADTLAYMRAKARVGMTTRELDELGERYLTSTGARSAPRITYGFPGCTCISVNNEVAHGIPGDRVFAEGDLVNIDVSAELGGLFGDTGGSFVLGKPTRNDLFALCEAAQAARDAGIAEAVHGARLGSIGAAVERVARRSGFELLRNLGSHGVGRKLHEAPEFIPGFNDPKEKRSLHKGLVITVEPFLTTGPRLAREAADGWTLFVDPAHRAAQFEHSIVVTEGAPILLTVPTRSFEAA